MTSNSIQSNMTSDNAIPIKITSSSADPTTSNSTTSDPKPTSHSALFGLTGQSSPTKFAGSGPGSGIIGTSGVKGKHNSICSSDAGGLTGGKMEAEEEEVKKSA